MSLDDFSFALCETIRALGWKHKEVSSDKRYEVDFPIIRIINQWNRLPHKEVSSSLEVVKHRLDSHLSENALMDPVLSRGLH